MHKFIFSNLLFLILFPVLAFSNTSLIADHTIFVNNFSFTPSELTIAAGESVEFINIGGLHDVNGVNSTITGESFGNPVEFSLPEILGTVVGVSMGEITFDQPGLYQYDCSVNLNAQLGMVGSINVVPNLTIADLFIDIFEDPDILPDTWLSSLAFETYLNPVLSGEGPFTVFVPNDEAVFEVMELLNLNQFDLLGFSDLGPALEYHVATGLWLEEDLEDGLSLPTVYGQNLTISDSNGTWQVEGASIITTNFLAANGVIHVIDECLAPTGLPQATVWDIIQNSEDHEFLETAIINAGLDEELQAQNEFDPSVDLPGPFTVFAPTNAAFEAYSQEVGISVSQILSGQFIDEIVKQVIVGEQVESVDFSDGQELQNYLGEDIEITVTGDSFFVEGIPLQVTDILAYNGVVHVIDEIVAPELPPIEGTCGTWTLELKDLLVSGWGDNFIQIEIDGELISTETLLEGGTESFEFGVDVGSIVNLRCSSNASSHSYEVYNSSNDLIYDSNASGTFDSPPTSVFGLVACPEPTTCGNVEIQMFDTFGDGWDVAQLFVFINGVQTAAIEMPFGFGPQKAYIPTNIADTLNFIYSGAGGLNNENSYIVYGPDGTELVNQFFEDQSPQSVYEIEVCVEEEEEEEEMLGIGNLSTENQTSIFPNPTTGELNIKSENTILRVSIYNSIGQKIYESPYRENRLNVSSLESGTFIMELQTVEGFEFHRFSIIR